MKLYEEQKDGSLKPVEMSFEVAKRVKVYLELKEKSLSLEEIKWLVGNEALYLV